MNPPRRTSCGTRDRLARFRADAAPDRPFPHVRGVPVRAAGILLHVTSLPGSPGLGDLGPAAIRFLDTLKTAGQTVWQVLPLNPTAFGDSPYQSPSTFAGNPLLVSPELLQADGLLESVPGAPEGDPARVDFGAVIPWKRALLRDAHTAFREGKGPASLPWDLDVFRDRERRWLDDYALFAALHDEQNRAWFEWPEELKLREPGAIAEAKRRLKTEIEIHEFAQFLFARQWDGVRAAAAERGVKILGDVPLFVAHDSADVWAHRDLFLLDETGRPTKVAGAPPDAFTDDGQLWGNPLYRWDLMEQNDFAWWVARIRRTLELYDVVRLDHFRGFLANWAVPAGDESAKNGAWEPVPGVSLLATLEREIGELRLVAEDLGDISPDVYALRDAHGIPGMYVLQFGFGGDPRTNLFAPHAIPRNAVAYPGTHDTETIRGWFDDGLWNATERPREEAEAEHSRVCMVTGSDGHDMPWAMCRVTMNTAAELAILPVQDLLGLGNEARMNAPGRLGGNWTWRLTDGQWNEGIVSKLGELTSATGRWPEEAESGKAAEETTTAASPPADGEPAGQAPHPPATDGAPVGDGPAPVDPQETHS
ncbi:MAG: 4-alpha-glucanotransferase [bacterium]